MAWFIGLSSLLKPNNKPSNHLKAISWCLATRGCQSLQTYFNISKGKHTKCGQFYFLLQQPLFAYRRDWQELKLGPIISWKHSSSKTIYGQQQMVTDGLKPTLSTFKHLDFESGGVFEIANLV